MTKVATKTNLSIDLVMIFHTFTNFSFLNGTFRVTQKIVGQEVLAQSECIFHPDVQQLIRISCPRLKTNVAWPFLSARASVKTELTERECARALTNHFKPPDDVALVLLSLDTFTSAC